jgi:hypothetical protein
MYLTGIIRAPIVYYQHALVTQISIGVHRDLEFQLVNHW